MTTVRRSLAAAAAAPVLLVASAAPGWALYRDDGDDPGPGISSLEVLGLYVGLPLLLFGLIALFVYAPALVEGPRYRPGWAWWHEPVWFGGPSGEQMEPAGSGAGAEPGAATIEGGGSSARW